MRSSILYHIALLVSAASSGRIDPILQAAVEKQGETEAIVEFPEVINQISGIDSGMSGDAKVYKLITSLKKLTAEIQAPLVTAAASLGLTTEQFWITNTLSVKGLTAEKLSDLAKISGDFNIRPENKALLPPMIQTPVADNGKTAQWGVETIRAPDVWNTTRGEGITVGIIDTGVNLGHVALSHSFNGRWLDPYYSTEYPTDVNGHGTHALGIILGSSNGVGVAPAAKWMACRGIDDDGWATESALTKCAEFMLKTYPRPNIVSNSWGFSPGNKWFNSAITAWRHAGIIPVFSSGNKGPDCKTVQYPADSPFVIAVGSTGEYNEASWFSSRGPSKDGSMKPDVSAPGNNIVSCGTGGYNYVSMSGTSMAAPHVAGAIALLLSATRWHPSYGFGDVYEALTTSGYKPTLEPDDRSCGLPTDADHPNYVYGHGRIDIANALDIPAGKMKTSLSKQN